VTVDTEIPVLDQLVEVRWQDQTVYVDAADLQTHAELASILFT
jgi:hypothetical protein